MAPGEREEGERPPGGGRCAAVLAGRRDRALSRGLDFEETVAEVVDGVIELRPADHEVGGLVGAAQRVVVGLSEEVVTLRAAEQRVVSRPAPRSSGDGSAAARRTPGRTRNRLPGRPGR